MTAQLSPTPVQQFFDNNGEPLFRGTLTTYAAGTTTPQATYVDSTQTTQNTNPITLNFRGECNLWLDPTLTYKLVLKDFFGNTIWTVDNISGGFTPSAIIQSLIPTPTNTWTLGNSTHSWAQLYLGANASPALDTASGIIGYYPRTAAEITAGVTPTNFSYPPNDVRRMGVVGDGSTDDTVALQKCFTVGGAWSIPAYFQIRCTSTITGILATRLYSDSSGGIGLGTLSAGLPQSYLVHDFSGTFFDLVGSASSNLVSSGFAFERLTFAQKNGNGTGASGSCIRSVQVSNTQKCTWLRITDCNFETLSGSVNDWTYCVQLDGTVIANPLNLRDIFIQRCRFVSGANATASMLLNGVSNVFLLQLEGNLTKGDISITGSGGNGCFSVFMAECTWNNVNIDLATGVYGAGNSASTVTTTANTLNVDLGCSCTGTVPTIAGTRVYVEGLHSSGKLTTSGNNNVRMEIGANTFECSGPVAINTNPAASGDVRLANAGQIVGRNSTNAGDIPLLSASSSNRVLIAPGGDTIAWGRSPNALGGGAAATLGTIGGTGPTTAAQFEWLQVFDTSGNACFIPVWK